MKASFALLAIGASLAAAQSLSDLPQCGQTCISNMIAIASSDLGCANGNVTCYCTEPDFGYGVRDCAHEACTSSGDADTVISFGTSYCANALQQFQSSASQGAATPTNSAGSVLASASGASGSGSGSGNTASRSAISTVPLLGVVTTDGSTVTTTTGSSTIYGGAGGASGSATSAAGSASSAASGAAGSASGAASSAAGSGTSAAGSAASSAGGAASSAASSAGDAASSAASSASDSGNVAPIQTAAPVLLGAAALAILAL